MVGKAERYKVGWKVSLSDRAKQITERGREKEEGREGGGKRQRWKENE